MTIIDGKNAILGRLASDTAKRLLSGETVEIINAKDVIITGNLTEDAMAEYYSNARVFVYPSLFEGFGFTPLEAMACGCPAASINAAAMPEILGDAPMYFDPCDTSDIYDKVSAILSDKDLSGKMSRKSLKRAKEFTWKAAAKKTRKVYEEVLQ